MRGKEGWVWSLAKAIASHVPVFKSTILQLFQKELKSLLMKAKEKREKSGLNIQKMNFMASSPITSCEIDGEIRETVRDFIFLGSKSVQMVTAAMKLKDTWKKSYDQPRQHIKKQRHYFVNKGLSSQSYGFSSSHVWM